MARKNPYAEDNRRMRDLSSDMYPVKVFGKATGHKTHKPLYRSIYNEEGQFVSRGLALKGPGQGAPRKGKSAEGKARAAQWRAEVMAIYRSGRVGSLKEAMIAAKAARQGARANPWSLDNRRMTADDGRFAFDGLHLNVPRTKGKKKGQLYSQYVPEGATLPKYKAKSPERKVWAHKWSSFVKKVKQQHGCTLGEAMKIASQLKKQGKF